MEFLARQAAAGLIDQRAHGQSVAGKPGLGKAIHEGIAR
jgi:hypothetical protein